MTEERETSEHEAALAAIARITGYDRETVERLSGCCNCPVRDHLAWGEARIREEYARRKEANP
jgi:hypothetical protein